MSANLSSPIAEEAYAFGDLGSEGKNHLTDFTIFRQSYDKANGLDEFANAMSSVPKPPSLRLLLLTKVGLIALRR
ncbi:MAG: hypothetical protein IT427_03455 [Pirellulales bacterium]|nr:hypothetical protein [Pirellulales bacterium]